MGCSATRLCRTELAHDLICNNRKITGQGRLEAELSSRFRAAQIARKSSVSADTLFLPRAEVECLLSGTLNVTAAER